VELISGARDPHQGWYCPEFGVALSAPVFRIVAASPETGFGYFIRERSSQT
jgi:hypothetical protein